MLEDRLDEQGLEPEDAVMVTQLLRQIWEGHAVGQIYDCYNHNLMVHNAFGEEYGREGVVRNALQQLAAFPNGQLRQIEAVSADVDAFVSVWAVRVATNTGYGVFGKPTGKKVAYPVASQYRLREGRIAEAWEVQDSLLLARQLGLRSDEAVTLASPWYHVGDPLPHATGDPERSRGQLAPDVWTKPAAGDMEPLIRWVWHELWNRRRLDRIAQHFSPDYAFLGPAGRRLRSRKDYLSFPLGLLAAFPDASMFLENVAVQRGADEVSAAVRWRLMGSHEGPGFGTPTRKRINLLGVTHQTLKGETFIAEKTVFDELSLLMQLRTADGEDGEVGLSAVTKASRGETAEENTKEGER